VTITETLPHWDLSDIYPGLDSPEFTAGFQHFVAEVEALTSLFDTLGIDRRADLAVDPTTIGSFEQIIARVNELLEQQSTLSAYIYSFVSTDATNNQAQAAMSELQQQSARMEKLFVRLVAWLGSLDVETLIARSPLAANHTFMLRKARVQAEHQMSPAEEALAADLKLTGGSAWSRFYSNYTAQIMVNVEINGTARELPMPAVRNLAFEADVATRRAGYEAEIAAWEKHARPIASALNAIKGEVNTLNRRRNWASPLDAALFNNNIDRDTLDAMMAAARESFPDFRRYLRAKAVALGAAPGSGLPWYDLFAPVGTGGRAWSYEEGSRFIVEQFGTFSPKMAQLAERAFSQGWIDAEPRPGKVGGAFCMGVRPGESRILSNFQPSIGQVGTLAHELGHAYHNLNLGQRTVLQRSTPMTLAETASIFCETIVSQAALHVVEPEEQLSILEASLQDACQVVVDITSRFLFEQQLFDQRQQRELSPDELCTLMLEAQQATYGDGIDQTILHPYMWAVKGHYYGSSFYNYPYMFGLLFGLGLFARYQAEPHSFQAGYDDLLSSTGMGDAAELAERYGINIRDIGFWRASFDVIRSDIDRFESLVKE
jgi:pepF/M3 family oligoendopeptidase